MNKKLIYILILFITVYNVTANDPCTDQANADVAANVLGTVQNIAETAKGHSPDPNFAVKLKNIAITFTKGWAGAANLLAAGSNLSGLISSVFGHAGATTCDLMKKLDEILNKLGELKNDLFKLKEAVECNELKRILNTINEKFHTLLLLRDKRDKMGLDGYKSSLKAVCSDPTEGINKIYSSFHFFYFTPQTVGDYIKNCAGYDSKRTVALFQYLSATHAKLLTFTTLCEEAYGIKKNTGFDYGQSGEDMIRMLEYYNKFYLIDRFFKDQDNHGLSKSVKDILDKADNAQLAQKTLAESYDFYDWDVIYYGADISGFERHQSWSSEALMEYGAIHFIRNIKEQEKTAFVAWSLKSDYRTGIENVDLKPIKGIQQVLPLNANKLADEIWELTAKKLNYVLCVREYTSKV